MYKRQYLHSTLRALIEEGQQLVIDLIDVRPQATDFVTFRHFRLAVPASLPLRLDANAAVIRIFQAHRLVNSFDTREHLAFAERNQTDSLGVAP